MAKNQKKGNMGKVTVPHTLHPTMGTAPGYATNVFVQNATEPIIGRAQARAIASQSPHLKAVKVAPHLHRRSAQ